MADLLDQLQHALRGRYTIERELGRGGMATVYLAHDVRHGRRVAIKVLHPELAAVIGADRFLVEITTTANLQHPHILGLIDSGEVGGIPYYVMPFVDGESLRDRLTREKQLPIDDALRLAREIADALAHAHRRSDAEVRHGRRLFSGSYVGSTRSTDYDVSPDGKRFLMIRSDRLDERIDVTTDWTALLKPGSAGSTR